jgi:hypothetical protein
VSDWSSPASSLLLSALCTGVFSFRWLLASASATFQDFNTMIHIPLDSKSHLKNFDKIILIILLAPGVRVYLLLTL